MAKEFGNFRKWPLEDLLEKERTFATGDQRGEELRTEIDHRLAVQNKRTSSVNLVAAIIAALAAIITIAYSLDRGIYIGSSAGTETVKYSLNEKTVVNKTCRYLFITGIAELPALGGDTHLPRAYAFTDNSFGSTPNSLHCEQLHSVCQALNLADVRTEYIHSEHFQAIDVYSVEQGGHFLLGLTMLQTTDFFQDEAKRCRDTAERAVRKEDREFWLSMASRLDDLYCPKGESNEAMHTLRPQRTIYNKKQKRWVA